MEFHATTRERDGEVGPLVGDADLREDALACIDALANVGKRWPDDDHLRRFTRSKLELVDFDGYAGAVFRYVLNGYGTVRAMAEELGEDEHVSLLTETLEEEKETDEKLTQLAQDANSEANVEEEGEGEVEEVNASEEMVIKNAGVKDKKARRVA